MKLSTLVGTLFSLPIYVYRVFRPFLGSTSCCRFTISCSEFALIQLRTEPLHRAFWAIIKRLGSCHPFHRQQL